jgi:hypothetical protein
VSRQLFVSTVASKIDYAASVWCSARKEAIVATWIGRPFEVVQRIATQAIVGAFRTTALPTAEAEAGIEPTCVRLRARIMKHWIICHTLPKDHPFWPCRMAAVTQDGRYPSPFKVLARHGPQCLSDLEVIRPFALDPWQRSLGDLIITAGSNTNELQEVGSARLWLFTSVSVRNGLVGTGLVVRVNQVNIALSNRTVGDDQTLNAHFAHLGTILEATSYVKTMLPRIQMSPWKIHVTIVVSNQTVLRSLAKPLLQGGQSLINLITDVITQLREMGAQVSLRPPAEEDLEVAARTHSLAREATTENRVIDPPPWAKVQLRASALRWARVNAKNHRKEVYRQASTGQFTRQLDLALPGPHTKLLYDDLDRKKASVLVQLRTGNARLNGYLHRIGQSDSDLCACGTERETVPHFLLRCVQWNEQRRALVETAGSGFGNLSYMLGGMPDEVDGAGDTRTRTWKPDIKVVKAVITFAMETKQLACEGG